MNRWIGSLASSSLDRVCTPYEKWLGRERWQPAEGYLPGKCKWGRSCQIIQESLSERNFCSLYKRRPELLSYSMNSQRLESAVTPQVPFLLGPFREQMAFSLLQPFFFMGEWHKRRERVKLSIGDSQPSCAVVAFFQESEKSKLKNFRLSLRPPFLKVKKKKSFFLIKEAPPQTGG